MTTTQDASISCEQEATYKTYATPTRSNEFADESLDWTKVIKQAKGVKSGRRMARSNRRAYVAGDGGGDLLFELVSKGLGKYFDSFFGTSTVTLVSGTTWQHVFTWGDNPKSLSVQKGIPQAGGTIDAETFLGVMLATAEFAFPNQDIGTVKFGTDIGDISTAQALAALAYPSGASLFHFGNWTISSGVLTAPTTTALGSFTTTFADFRDATVTLDNHLTQDRFNGGGVGRKSKPTVGLRDGQGQATIEYDSTTFRDAMLNETPMALMFQYTGAALSTGVETIQLILPEVKFDSELAKTNGTDLATQAMKFTVVDNEIAAQPVWLVIRTSDAAL